MTNQDLIYPNRTGLAAALQRAFPHLSPSDVALSPTRGGRAAALTVLANVKPQSYQRSRNYLDGDVTRLSAYLRHGVLTLAEVRDNILRHVTNQNDAVKLINELTPIALAGRARTALGTVEPGDGAKCIILLGDS